MKRFFPLLFSLLVSLSYGIKIMPVGDSNTVGYQPPSIIKRGGGYRYQLEKCLKFAFTFTFVGPTNENPVVDLVNKNHCGFNGICIDYEPVYNRYGISTSIVNYLNVYSPNIVLLQIGTNDLSLGRSPSETLTRLTNLIFTIKTKCSIVYVSNLPNLLTNTLEVQQFNSGLAAVILTTNSRFGPDVYNITLNRMVDNFHPTEPALDDVGKAWARILRNDWGYTSLPDPPTNINN